MYIVFHVMGMPFDGDTIDTKSLGGSESAAYYQARELAARGHKVTVFSNTEKDSERDGVVYCNLGNATKEAPLGDRFEYYTRNTPHDVLIIQRHPVAFHNLFASKINILQLHDLALHRSSASINHGMWNVDAVTAVSQWHKKQICDVYGLHEDIVRVVPNGVDADLYEPDGERGPFFDRMVGAQNKFKLLYQSRPERGLENLVKAGGIMDRLQDTDAHLYFCGYDNTVPQMKGYYEMLYARAKELGNCTNLGSLTKAQLASLQQSCDLAVYPTEFEEVSCITAMECMHAGLPLLTTPIAALPETCAGAGVQFVNSDKGISIDGFVKAIRRFMDGPKEKQKLHNLSERQLQAAHLRTWVSAVDELEKVIRDAFIARAGSVEAQQRHLMEHSDVMLLDHVLYLDPNESSQIEQATGREFRELYSFIESTEAYAAHYDKHQAKYYDDFEDKVVGEDVSASARFRGVVGLIGQEYQTNKNLHVLDYGCAHGHYLMPLARAMPTATFIGMDVSARAIGAAMKWAQRDKLENVELRIGSQADLTLDVLCPMVDKSPQTISFDGEDMAIEFPLDSARKLFDVILAGEVLEHVPDWHGLLTQFKQLLTPRGVIVVTTPAGRWEWTGTENFRTGREHLHHFEKADIEEICGKNPVEIIYTPASFDRTGRYLGSWVWAVRPIQEFQRFDVQRKLSHLAPRQTLSACLIVKDGEKTIRKCVDSFIDYVDEVIVGIDESTTDRTRQILNDIQSDYKLKPFTVFNIKPALETGFDEARNTTVKRAAGEWILWCDADEEVQQAWNLWKYLRHSQIDGFGFPQIHYSTNPPQVLTTDYPIRLFRNNGEIQFYGVVHEHPEVEPGKSVPRAIMRPDVQFLHSGYVDEETRRARFRRNLPLLHRDMAKYKDRRLNSYLWLRDIAQQLQFESEQVGGAVLEGHAVRGMEGIDLFEKMMDNDPIRIVLDAFKYYSHCVAVTGKGFQVKMQFGCATQQAPDIAATFNFDGMIYSVSHLTKLMTKLKEEATKNYEAKYL
jgi:glycosyltransferase involved in cell wall biosynthesis/SAM-dependent methyltransferase